MTELSHEIGELKEFIQELRADHAAQKEKEQRERWTRHTALSLVFIAALTAVAAQRAGKYSGAVLKGLNDATLHQAEASDQWSYYQAKSIKQNLYEVTRDQAGKNPAVLAADPPGQADPFAAKVAKYDAEKKAIQQKAEALEQQRDLARKTADDAGAHGSGLGTAISIYQIAIALGSICLLTKRKPLWYLSLVLAALGTVKMLWVWFS